MKVSEYVIIHRSSVFQLIVAATENERLQAALYRARRQVTVRPIVARLFPVLMRFAIISGSNRQTYTA